MRRISPDIACRRPLRLRRGARRGRCGKNLFADGRASLTLLLSVPFFLAFAVLALTVVWSPILLNENGIPPAQASIALGIHGLGALVGMSLAGRLIERFGAGAVLVPALVLGAIVTSATGYSATSLPTMSVTLALIGLFVGCGASGSIALAALEVSDRDPLDRHRLGDGRRSLRPGAGAAVRWCGGRRGLEQHHAVHGRRPRAGAGRDRHPRARRAPPDRRRRRAGKDLNFSKCFVIASVAKQSRAAKKNWIASALRASQ